MRRDFDGRDQVRPLLVEVDRDFNHLTLALWINLAPVDPFKVYKRQRAS